jgi:hypothetical protein
LRVLEAHFGAACREVCPFGEPQPGELPLTGCHSLPQSVHHRRVPVLFNRVPRKKQIDDLAHGDLIGRLDI